MILSDRDLLAALDDGTLRFTPTLERRQIGPCSIDLRLGQDFKTFRVSQLPLLDPKKGIPENYLSSHVLNDDEMFVLHPNNFVLASTRERITMPDHLMVRVEGKSTLARMGILVHTAGFVDPGFEGNLTLQISNQSNLAIALYPGMFICQVAVQRLSSPAEIPYNKRKESVYKNSHGTVAPNPKNLFS